MVYKSDYIKEASPLNASFIYLEAVLNFSKKFFLG